VHLLGKTLIVVVLSAAAVVAQPIRSWNSAEDYCRDNPNAPTCRDGKPIHVQADMQKMWKENSTQLGIPKSTSPKAKTPAAPQTVVPASTPAPAGTQYTLVPPSPSRLRKGPADIRLGELDWRLVLPQADLLVGLNISDLLQSDLARALIRDWAGKLGVTAAEQDKLLANLGDISQAVISVHQREVLIVLMGRVDDFPETNQTGPMQSVKVSPDTVILGSNQTLYWTLFRLKFALTPSTQLKEAQQLSAAYQVWAWGKPAAFAAFGQAMSGSSSIAKAKFGLSLRDQFRMDMILDTASPVAARHLIDTSGKNTPRDLQAAIEGDSVHYTMQLDRATTLARFGGLMPDSAGKQLAPLLAAAREMAARKASPPVRSSPSKVVIEGLDDGPREVSLPKP